MNNKVKFALAIGTFIILVVIGTFLMKKEEEVVFYSGEERILPKICAYVVGEVNSPGIFEVEDGTRVYQIIEMAGGTTEDADISRINLAKIVVDEEKINVPAKVVLEESEESNSKMVNINSASVEKLSSLNGIGKSTAEKIVKYREENGYFNTIEEIMNVSGIGESKFNSIKDNIEVFKKTINLIVFDILFVYFVLLSI